MMGSTNDPSDKDHNNKAVAGSIFIAVAVYGVRLPFSAPGTFAKSFVWCMDTNVLFDRGSSFSAASKRSYIRDRVAVDRYR